MFWLHILYAADEFIFPRQLAQPGTPGDIIAGPWVNPDIIYLMVFTKRYDINPCQNISAVILLPALDILFGGAYINRAREVHATMAALFAGKFQGVLFLHCQRCSVDRPVRHIPD